MWYQVACRASLEAIDHSGPELLGGVDFGSSGRSGVVGASRAAVVTRECHDHL
jgi:hypothetical protein